jgi:hypothetical protein
MQCTAPFSASNCAILDEIVRISFLCSRPRGTGLAGTAKVASAQLVNGMADNLSDL